jgi:hypothetical protein
MSQNLYEIEGRPSWMLLSLFHGWYWKAPLELTCGGENQILEIASEAGLTGLVSQKKQLHFASGGGKEEPRLM